jgi:hypothetical protein
MAASGLRGGVTDSAVQADVVVMPNVALVGLREKSNTTEPAHPEVWPLEPGRLEAIIETDEETERREAKEDCGQEVINFAWSSSFLDAEMHAPEDQKKLDCAGPLFSGALAPLLSNSRSTPRRQSGLDLYLTNGCTRVIRSHRAVGVWPLLAPVACPIETSTFSSIELCFCDTSGVLRIDDLFHGCCYHTRPYRRASFWLPAPQYSGGSFHRFSLATDAHGDTKQPSDKGMDHQAPPLLQTSDGILMMGISPRPSSCPDRRPS